ncbi:DsbA family protein [Parvibaculum sp.]|uniref:DsbA family protein n=1 Tax=Parvibaculum sp. TaxID=2024848 RepID=UPI00320D7659
MIKTALSRAGSTFLTSRALRDARRTVHAARRRLRGARPTVLYFHQADDPYSHVAAQSLRAIADRYALDLVPMLVSPPEDSAAPERAMLRAYALRDAVRLAAEYGYEFPADASAPDAELVALCNSVLLALIAKGMFVELAPIAGHALLAGDAAALHDLAARHGASTPDAVSQRLAEGDALRKRLGHYLGGMFHFEGEWYWGIDRLCHLEERLAEAGLDRMPKGARQIAPRRDLRLANYSKGGPRLVIDYWFSFRSPYSWISFPRMKQLADHYGAELRLRFILPMVMRGLPVPRVKRMYIMLDTKREAEKAGIPFGTVVDPVGAGAERALAVLHRAIGLGRGEAFAELGQRAAFADGIDLASDEGLYDVARRAGLDEAAVRAALADESWRPIAEENRKALFAAGLWGAPTFRVNDMPAHWGQDRFWALEEDILGIVGSDA